MAELTNTFSWSFSAAEDFEECRRRRYWAKYAMWGGWSRDAAEEPRTAYRLCKMENRYSLLGNAVEQAVMWVLRQKQAGRDATVEEAYQEIARPYLNRAWKESREKRWEQNPKKYCCLHEHYYATAGGNEPEEWTRTVAEHTRQCLANFIASVLPGLAQVRREQEIAVATVAQGDPESFDFGGVKVYAIPDYVYRAGTAVHIYDWKAGKPRENHADQLALYGFWANTKHGIPAANIYVHIEYLLLDSREVRQLTEADLQGVEEKIRDSVQDMAEYLVNGDIRRNEPVPKQDWDLASSRGACRWCNFLELCAPELGQE
ncbi:MAG: PD-(D/E)XK nuclease family protein [Kiritimatiellae bacterium]|nr:PD-(D/E)XK nuclease family protein [Kiritimatiellia bacterium]